MLGYLASVWLVQVSWAQDKPATSNPQISTKDQTEDVRPAPFPLEIKPDRKSDVTVGKRFRMAGPLITLFKSKSVREAPKRFLQLVNPFQRQEETTPNWSRYSDLNPRAWTTMVGWRPSASAFPDPVTHEGGMVLMGASLSEK